MKLLILAALASLTLAAAPARRTPEETAFRQAAAERYLQYSKAVREQVLTPASCPFAPASVALVVGTDPAKLAEWVRRRIAYEPYAGVVRGAEGTLAARGGGDWDRAVLLQALLAEAGYRSELKVLARTPQEQAAVVDQYLKRPPTISTWFAEADPAAGPAATREPIALVKQFGAVPENRQHYARQEAARVRQMLDEALDAAAHETPRMLAALAPAAKVGQSFDAWRADVLAGAAERVDVEIQTPSGPSLLSVAPDATPADAGRLASATSLETPPAEKVAKLAIRLELTAGEEGKRAAAPVKLIDREMPIGNLFRRPIRLEIVPSDDAAAAKATAAWTKDDWSKFVGGFKNFQAILRVGDEWEGSKVFDSNGQVHGVAADGRVENATQIGGAVGQGFGGGLFGGGGADEPAATKSESGIESLVLVMELSLPGQKPQTQQRLIFGRERANVTPVFTADALVTAGPVSAHAISWLVLDATTRNAPLATRLITSDDPRRFEQTEDAARVPVMLYDWHTIRLIAADRLTRPGAGVTFRSGPSIVMHATHVTMPTSKDVATRHAIDVAFETSTLLPRSADRTDAAARANATFGVAATVLESGLLRVINPAQGTRGAYVAFEESRAAGAQPVAVSAGADAAAAKPPPLVAWSLSRNESNRALLFAGGATNRAWWSVDPATGAAIGRGDGGEGQSAMEYLQITKKNVENLKCMVGLSNQILGGDSGQEQAKQWFLCMTGTDNPGSGHGIPGGIEGGLDSDAKVIQSLDLGFGPLADALGGAKDLYDIMNGDNPVLYTGR